MQSSQKSQFITRYKFKEDVSKPNRLFESVKVGEVYVSRLTMKPGVVAGNLYHKETNSIFFVTKGSVNIKCVQVETKEEKEMLGESGFGIIHQPPFTAIALKNIGDDDAIVIFFSDKRLRGDDDFEFPIYDS